MVRKSKAQRLVIATLPHSLFVQVPLESQTDFIVSHNDRKFVDAVKGRLARPRAEVPDLSLSPLQLRTIQVPLSARCHRLFISAVSLSQRCSQKGYKKTSSRFWFFVALYCDSCHSFSATTSVFFSTNSHVTLYHAKHCSNSSSRRLFSSWAASAI